jgi:hypothetical protein
VVLQSVNCLHWRDDRKVLSYLSTTIRADSPSHITNKSQWWTPSLGQEPREEILVSALTDALEPPQVVVDNADGRENVLEQENVFFDVKSKKYIHVGTSKIIYGYILQN